MWGRLAMWLLFVLIAALLFGQIRHEAEVRTRDICGVIINVHTNAKFRAETERVNVLSTEDFLADPEARAENKALYDRIKENLPIVRQRLADAQRNVIATTPPPTCREYRADSSIDWQLPLLPKEYRN